MSFSSQFIKYLPLYVSSNWNVIWMSGFHFNRNSRISMKSKTSFFWMLIYHLLPSNQDFYVGTCHIFTLLMKCISVPWQWDEIGPFKKPLDRHQRKGVSRWTQKLILFPIFPNTKGVIFNPSLIHLHQRSIQKDKFAYVAHAAGKFWAQDWENGIWLSFRVSFPFPLAHWCTLWLRLFLVLFLSLCHTHIKTLQWISLTKTNLSACPRRRDPHQVLRFPQKPKRL